MKNFQSGGNKRQPSFGGRPRSDVNNYAPKTRTFDKPRQFDKRDDRRGSDRESKSFEATCTVCGKRCDVPFRPDGVKPVLCRDCYARKSGSTAPEHNRPATGPSGAVQADMAAFKKQLNELESKMDEILTLLKKPTSELATTPEVAEAVTEKKPVKLAKKAVAKKTAPKKAPAKKVAAKPKKK